jgi:telomere length regulation protein
VAVAITETACQPLSLLLEVSSLIIMDSSTTREDDPSESLREIVSSLRSPIAEETTLLQLLAAPLACFGILPAQYRKYDKSPIVWNQRNNLARWIPLLQTNILENVLPTWGEPLKEDGLDTLLEAYFCPSRNQNSPTSSYAPVFALHAYSSLLHPPIQEFSVRLLARLSVEYPLPEIHRTIFSADFDVILSHSKEGKKTTTWEDFVRVAFSVPAKVANALAEKSTVPNELLHT